MAALEVYRTGLDKFPSDVSLLTGMSRIYEALGNITLSAKYYKMVLNVSRIFQIHNHYCSLSRQELSEHLFRALFLFKFI